MKIFSKFTCPLRCCFALVFALTAPSSQSQEVDDEFEQLIESLDAEAMRVPKDAAYHLELKKLLVETSEALEEGDLAEAAWRVEKMEEWNRPAIKKEFAKMGYLMMQDEFRAAADKKVEATFKELEDLVEKTVETIRTVKSEAELVPVGLEIEQFENRLKDHSWMKERLGERFDNRLLALRSLVDHMADFFAEKEIGDRREAIRSLDTAASKAVGRPVFSMENYEKHVRSVLPGLVQIFDRDPSELSIMAREFEKWKSTAPAALAEEIEELEEAFGRLLEAEKEAEAGRFEHAVRILKSSEISSARLGGDRLDRVKEFHIGKLFSKMASQHTDTAMEDGESVEVFLIRSLDAEAEKEDYESFLALVRLYRLIGMRSDIPRWMSADEAGVAAYVRAARYLDAGDPSAAIPHLRRVVSEIDGKYTPVEKAGTQLKEALAAVDDPPSVAVE